MKKGLALLSIGLMISLSGCGKQSTVKVSVPLVEETMKSYTGGSQLIFDKITIDEYYGDNQEVKEDAIRLIGNKYPYTSFAKADKSKLDISKIKGPIVIEYGASFCGACMNAIPIIENMKEKYPDITFLTIVSGEIQDQQIVFSENGLEGEVYSIDVDSGLTTTEFQKMGYPYFIFLDEDKVVKYVSLGTDDVAFEEAIKLSFKK